MHSPLPWEIRRAFCNDRIGPVSDPEVTIATMGNWHAQFAEEKRDNATLIVRAVNSHEKFALALKSITERSCGCHDNADPEWHISTCWRLIAQKALREAGYDA
jgi:hypothetical protein